MLAPRPRLHFANARIPPLRHLYNTRLNALRPYAIQTRILPPVRGPTRLPGNCVSTTTSSQRLDPPPPPSQGWVSRLPDRIQPYVLLTRLDKPIAWAILMSSFSLDVPPEVPLGFIGVFGVGALIMRGAGCTINDMWDRDLDKAVERTKLRPIASGDITHRKALVFLAGQLTLGLAVLTQLNWYSIFLGASSLSVVAVYPLMKRITYWPQFVLGLAFNWGSLLGWSAVAGAVDWTICLPLYAGSICWTIVYDTIYAHQDKIDDGPAGIRSTALLFGENTRPILTGFALASTSLISYSGLLNHQGPIFFAAMVISGVELVRLIWTTRYDERESCWKSFVGCGRVGLLITLGLGADYTLDKLEDRDQDMAQGGSIMAQSDK